MKAIPIKFNNEQLRDLEDLQDLLGIRGIYGADPQAIKISLKLAIAKIKQDQQDMGLKVIPSLKGHEKQLYLSSISRPVKEQISLELKQKGHK